MIDNISNSSAMHSAMRGLSSAMQQLDQKAARVAEGNPDADKIVALKVAQQNAKIQAENVRAAVEATEQILDILV